MQWFLNGELDLSITKTQQCWLSSVVFKYKLAPSFLNPCTCSLSRNHSCSHHSPSPSPDLSLPTPHPLVLVPLPSPLRSLSRPPSGNLLVVPWSSICFTVVSVIPCILYTITYLHFVYFLCYIYLCLFSHHTISPIRVRNNLTLHLAHHRCSRNFESMDHQDQEIETEPLCFHHSIFSIL